ncbi:hypothetical protein HaLaN_25646, partial [Haematococcus lacustris]
MAQPYNRGTSGAFLTGWGPGSGRGEANTSLHGLKFRLSSALSTGLGSTGRSVSSWTLEEEERQLCFSDISFTKPKSAANGSRQQRKQQSPPTPYRQEGVPTRPATDPGDNAAAWRRGTIV